MILYVSNKFYFIGKGIACLKYQVSYACCQIVTDLMYYVTNKVILCDSEKAYELALAKISLTSIKNHSE